eukprot:9298144-Lingulodinium_polyedra.AAC.1
MTARARRRRKSSTSSTRTCAVWPTTAEAWTPRSVWPFGFLVCKGPSTRRTGWCTRSTGSLVV